MALANPKHFFPQMIYQVKDDNGVPLIAKGSPLTLYGLSDTGFTNPLPVYRNDAGFPVDLASNVHGMCPPFVLDGHVEVVWAYEGISGHIYAREGVQGKPGLPGVNAVPTDAALAEYVGTAGTETRDALDNRYTAKTQLDELIAQNIADGEFTRAAFLATTADLFEPKTNAVVSITECGALMDGTDDLPAYLAAFALSNRVYVPAGVSHISESVKVPSNSELFGAGMDSTTIKLMDSAPPETDVVTNADMTTGATQIYLHDFTADWNYQRIAGDFGGSGGSRSSCVVFRNTQYGYVDRVRGINAGLHSFDVTAGQLDYDYSGDGIMLPTPSRHIYFDRCIAEEWHDDGFTTHHSEYIHFTNCYAKNPRTLGNNNGFEIDDATRHVTMTANTSENCYAGIEIKAHGTSTAANEIIINGHRSIRDVRSYNFRHIGHNSEATQSNTAYNIVASNLVSLWPFNSAGFHTDIEPKALVIQSFARVTINGFMAIGDPEKNYNGGNPVDILYNARDVNLSGVTITGFKNASNDIYINGSSGGRINLSNINVYDSGKRALGAGSGATGVNIVNFIATAPATGSDYGFGLTSGSGIKIVNAEVNGYPTQLRASGKNYTITRGNFIDVFTET